MTPEEMGKALGPGWLWQAGWREAPGSWQWFLNGPEAAGVEVEEAGEDDECWTVSVHDNEGNMATLAALAPDQAVAVAGLLVAAERIAGGAAVQEPSPGSNFLLGILRNNCPAGIRRVALDLLRAADEAEAQP